MIENVLKTSINLFCDDYEKGVVGFKKEMDVHAHFYSNLISAFKESDFNPPYPVQCEAPLLSYGRSKLDIDLMMGNNDTAIEIKFEPDKPDYNVIDTEMALALRGNLEKYYDVNIGQSTNYYEPEKDLIKLMLLKKVVGIKNGYLFFLDEKGTHKDKMGPKKFKTEFFQDTYFTWQKFRRGIDGKEVDFLFHRV